MKTTVEPTRADVAGDAVKQELADPLPQGERSARPKSDEEAEPRFLADLEYELRLPRHPVRLGSCRWRT